MHWVQTHDPAGRVLALPNQTPGVLSRYGLSHEQVRRAAWTIGPHDRKLSGAAAINRVLIALGGIWGYVGSAYRLPPLRWLEDRGYGWIADHRCQLSALWGTTPACERPDVTCE